MRADGGMVDGGMVDGGVVVDVEVVDVVGEWLRRQRRRVDARAQLREARGLFLTIGMEA